MRPARARESSGVTLCMRGRAVATPASRSAFGVDAAVIPASRSAFGRRVILSAYAPGGITYTRSSSIRRPLPKAALVGGRYTSMWRPMIAPPVSCARNQPPLIAR